LGNGDGTFQPVVSYNSGGKVAWSVTIADLNGDGKPDLVVANACGTAGKCNSDGSVGVLLGNGNGTFQPALSYDSGGWYAESLAVADVNGDHKPDLIVTNFEACFSSCPNGSVGVLLGNGNGTFQAALSYDSGALDATSVAVADVNGDGAPDLLVADYWGGTVGVLLNNTPFCTTAPTITLSATPKSLWPPNGKMVPVTVSGRITDTDRGCAVKTAVYAVKDEYGKVQPSGPVTLGSGGAYSLTVWLQASRLGTDPDGRLYTISVSATNNAGKKGSQAGTVIVPHDQGH
jgi:FG-GAP-like repeat